MRSLIAIVVLQVLGCLGFAQNASDPSLLAEINKIQALDNHTHIPKVVAAGEKDDDYDALPCYLLEPSPDSLMARRKIRCICRHGRSCSITSTTTAIPLMSNS